MMMRAIAEAGRGICRITDTPALLKPLRTLSSLLLAVLVLLFSAVAGASSASPLLVGALRTVDIAPGTTLMELAVTARVGYDALAKANPGIDPWQPPPRARVLLPTQAIVPEGAREGITVNLPELRLYHIRPSPKGPQTRFYPIGIGTEDWNTPMGMGRVVEKRKKPTWTPPASIRAERPELPARIPPGPNNPLGEYWIGTSLPGIGIHGTHKPMGVGRRVSHGCMRLYPDHIRTLYETIETGTPVSIVYQPIKAAVHEGVLYLEVHPDYLDLIINPLQTAWDAARLAGWEDDFDYGAALRIIKEQRGVPLPVSEHAETALK